MRLKNSHFQKKYLVCLIKTLPSTIYAFLTLEFDSSELVIAGWW